MVPYGLKGEDLLRVLDADRRRRLQQQFHKHEVTPRWRTALGARLVVTGAKLARIPSPGSLTKDVLRQVRA